MFELLSGIFSGIFNLFSTTWRIVKSYLTFGYRVNEEDFSLRKSCAYAGTVIVIYVAFFLFVLDLLLPMQEAVDPTGVEQINFLKKYRLLEPLMYLYFFLTVLIGALSGYIFLVILTQSRATSIKKWISVYMYDFAFISILGLLIFILIIATAALTPQEIMGSIFAWIFALSMKQDIGSMITMHVIFSFAGLILIAAIFAGIIMPAIWLAQLSDYFIKAPLAYVLGLFLSPLIINIILYYASMLFFEQPPSTLPLGGS